MKTASAEGYMGKGDRRSEKGKRVRGSYGRTRSRHGRTKASKSAR